MSDLFISYSRDDRAFVERLHAEVKASGRDAWLDKFDIEKGEKFWREIEQGIDGANAFVFVISLTSIKKAAGAEEYCRREIEYAVRQGKRIIPIVWRDRFQPSEQVENWLDKEIPAHRELMERNWLEICDRDFESCFSELINTAEKDLDYVKLHTKLLENARDWIREGRKDSDLIRGEALSKAEIWLKLGEQKVHLQSEKTGRKHPDPEATEDHRNFIHQSRLAEDSRLRQETLMRRAIIWGGGILAISLVGAGIATSGAMRASKLRQEAEIGTRLEQTGVKALEQFKEQQTEGLLTAMRSVVELRTLVQDGRPIEEYPTVTPLLALQMNLDNLQEYPLKRHQGSVEVMQFSPDGKSIATAEKDGTTIIWDLTGKELSQLKGHQGAVRVVKFSPDSKIIVTGGEDGITQLWDLNGKKLLQLKGSKVEVTAIRFNPDGKTIVTGDKNGIVRLWDFNGKELLQFKGHDHNVIEIQFSPDGKNIITQGQNILSVTMARLWDLNGKAVNKFDIPTEEVATKAENSTLKSIQFSSDGKTIVTGIAGGNLRLWDVGSNTLKQSKILDLGRSISLKFSPDGKNILCSGGYIMYLWKIEDQELVRFTVPAGDYIADGQFSLDGKTIIAGESNGSSRIWDLKGNNTPDIFRA